MASPGLVCADVIRAIPDADRDAAEIQSAQTVIRHDRDRLQQDKQFFRKRWKRLKAERAEALHAGNAARAQSLVQQLQMAKQQFRDQFARDHERLRDDRQRLREAQAEARSSP